MDSKQQQQDVLTAEQLLAGAQIQPVSSESLAEKLHKMFKPSDYVRIKNIDEVPSGWIFVDPADELVERPDNVTRRVTPGKPQATVLQPGETKVIPGWQGYIALDRLWKDYAQRHSTKDKPIMSNDVAMDNFLSESYLGVFDPNSVNEARPVVNEDLGKTSDSEPDDGDLGFDDEDLDQES